MNQLQTMDSDEKTVARPTPPQKLPKTDSGESPEDDREAGDETPVDDREAGDETSEDNYDWEAGDESSEDD